MKPVINITRKLPTGPVLKYARVTFPESFRQEDVQATLDKFPEALGFRCDLRQVGPQGFSVPMAAA